MQGPAPRVPALPCSAGQAQACSTGGDRRGQASISSEIVAGGLRPRGKGWAVSPRRRRWTAGGGARGARGQSGLREGLSVAAAVVCADWGWQS